MKILWIVLVWPEVTSSAAGMRTTQLVYFLQEAGHEVQVSSPCKTNAHREKLDSNYIPTFIFEPNNVSFDVYIKNYNPDIVIFDRFMTEEQFSWRVKEQCPNAIRILDTIDLHSLRRARTEKFKKNKIVSNLTLSELQTNDAIREVASIYRSDLSLIISDYEYLLLQNHYKIPNSLIGMCRYFCELQKDSPKFENRTNFICIGNFNHAPNHDSFHFLHQHLWKRIKLKLNHLGQNHVELHIYGSYLTPDFLRLDNPLTGFRVKGWCENVSTTMQYYRINLAPLRFGAGIKGKISDGWANGTPCITTPIGAEGMHEGYEFGGCVEEDWEIFAESSAALYFDEHSWNKKQEYGYHIIKKLYNKNDILNNLTALLKNTINNLESRRVENFFGQMLWHHQFRSTEYFSRWIEAKNKV
jgi:O-antigen biosynthesis protein